MRAEAFGRLVVDGRIAGIIGAADAKAELVVGPEAAADIQGAAELGIGVEEQRGLQVIGASVARFGTRLMVPPTALGSAPFRNAVGPRKTSTRSMPVVSTWFQRDAEEAAESEVGIRAP